MVANDPALASVSVIHDDCMRADAWATALFALGLEKGMSKSNALGLMAIFQLTNTDFQFSEAANSLRI